jgi:hypothetical protein
MTTIMHETKVVCAFPFDHHHQQQQQTSLLFLSKLGRLEMKPHKQKKNMYKTKAKKKEKTKGDKKIKSKKGEKTIKR